MGGVPAKDDDVKTADTQLGRSERSPACGDRVVLVDVDKTGRAKEQGIQRRLSARVFGVDPRRKTGREDNGHDVLFMNRASETAERVARPNVVRLKAIVKTVAVVRQVVADRGIAAAIALRLAVRASHVLDVGLGDLIRAVGWADGVADGAKAHLLRHTHVKADDLDWRPMVATNVPRHANRLNAGTGGACNRDALPLDRASLILEVVALGYQFLARELRVVRNGGAVLRDLDVGNAARVPLLLRIWVAAWVLAHNAILDLDQFAHVDRPYRQRIRAGQRLEIGQNVDAAVIRDVVALGRNVWRVGDTQRD